MRRAGKVDSNQAAIVSGLQCLGASVQLLSAVGQGCPDLLVGWKGKNFLIEVKNLEGRGNKLTPDQVKWHKFWNGQKAIATNLDEAILIINCNGLESKE